MEGILKKTPIGLRFSFTDNSDCTTVTSKHEEEGVVGLAEVPIGAMCLALDSYISGNKQVSSRNSM